MIYVTGDCHACYNKFSSRRFPDQSEMTKNDFVIVCGDFGLWHDCEEENYWLNWLNDKPFTTLFVDGNHENFDRLYGNEFPEVEFHGGKAHLIRSNIYHLMRGNIFTLQGKKFFAFGGASSHDIQDGILDAADFRTQSEFMDAYRRWRRNRMMFRVNHQSWWKQELPSSEEMQFGKGNLIRHGNSVDFVISHCLPQSVASAISSGLYQKDALTQYFDSLIDGGIEFSKWYCGHYHLDMKCFDKYHILYNNIVRIL